MIKQNTFQDFDVYTRALIASNDVDPTYPVVEWIIEKYNFEPEWFVFCYVAFYSLESAILMCRYMPTRKHWSRNAFQDIRKTIVTKFGHERRWNARNEVVQMNMFEHIIQWLDNWYWRCENNMKLRERISLIPNHGWWASFKIAELFEKSLNREEFIVKDLGLDWRDPNSNDWPVWWLRHLYWLDKTYTRSVFKIWNKFGAELAKGYWVNIGEIETALCKFHKMSSWQYFIGHDVQEFCELERVMGEEDYRTMMNANFAPVLWDGVKHLQKEKKGIYKTTGEILNESFSDNLPQLDIERILSQSILWK